MDDIATPICYIFNLSLLEIVFDQIQCYFTVNKLRTDFQHAYREGHSTSTALTQMTDWLREIDDKKD